MMITSWLSGLLLCFLSGVISNCQFLHDDLQCLDDSVEYQCIVNGAAMAWIVQDTNGTEIMGSISYTSFAIGASQSLGGGLFTIEQIPPLSPITTNISFTVQSSINGYTIICNGGAAGSYNFTVNIPGAPAIPPSNIMVDTFGSSSVHVTWTDSSSPCVTGYRFNISSSALEESIIMESTSNSVMVESLIPSNYQYNFVIAAFDTADRLSDDSDACFLFNVPGCFQNLDVYSETGSGNNTVKVLVTWDAPIENTSSCEFYPTLTGYEASITTIVSITLPGPVTLPPTATNYTFDNIPEGVDYTITVIARNGVGSTSTNILYEAPGIYIISTSPSSSSSSLNVQNSSTMTSTSTITRSFVSISTYIMYISPSTIPTCISPSVSAGISVAITVPVTAAITAIITVTILYLCQRRVPSNKTTPPQDYETPISTNEVEIKGNTAYGQVKHSTGSPTTTATDAGATYESMYM